MLSLIVTECLCIIHFYMLVCQIKISISKCLSEAETACQKLGGRGGVGIHEVGSYLLLYTFILNTSGIGY